jgi:pimeloyl-ACP methyl ester carboxylesterase
MASLNMQMEPRFIDVGGVDTRIFDAGQGESVVLIHGGNLGSRGGCISAENWSLNWPYFTSRYRCVAIDRLGQGMTDVPALDSGFTMGASVSHAIATLDVLGVRRAHLVGHSRGGYVAVAIALARPDLVASCTVADSGTLAPGVDDNHFVLAGLPKPFLGRTSQKWVFERSSFNESVVSEEWLEEGVRLAMLDKNIDALRRMEEGLARTVFQPQLDADKARVFRQLAATGMPCPTLVVWARNDPLAGVENGLELYRMFKARQARTEFCLINRAGHFVFREKPEVFNRAVHGFIQGLST